MTRRVKRSRLVHALVAASVAVALVGLTGCKKKAKVLWSCNLPMMETTSLSGTRVCTDVYASWKTCSTTETKSETPCKHDDAIGGCRHKDGDFVEWFYANTDRGFVTPQQIASYCEPGTLLLPDGDAGIAKTNDQLKAEEQKKYLAEDGAKAKATLATVATIAAKVPAPTGKLDLQGLKGDALLVHKEDLGTLESPKKIDYRIAEAGRLAACSRLLNGRKYPSDEPYELSYCAKDPFVAVLSVSTYEPAAATGSSVSGHTKTTYVKRGKIAGDVLLFRTDNGKYLGSVPFVVDNDDGTVTSPQLMTERLLDKFPSALHTKLRAAAPGVTNTSLSRSKT